MKRLLPLCITLLALNGWAQTLESNVRTALVRLELDSNVGITTAAKAIGSLPGRRCMCPGALSTASGMPISTNGARGSNSRERC